MRAIKKSGLLTGAFGLALAQTAAAHVVVAPTAIEAGRSTVVALRPGHGCDGSPTKAIRVELPAEVIAARPQVKPGWTIAIERDQAGGRTRAITWSGGLVPDDQYDDFNIQVTVKAGAGSPVYLPVVQTCVTGESRWAEQPAPGQNPHDLKRPAPSLTVQAPPPLATLKGLVVESGWVRATPPGAPTAAAYLVIRNTGPGEDRLIGGRSSAAGKVEVHTMSMDGGVMRMRPLAGGLALPAHGEASLQPGGNHLMLIGPTAPIVAGGSVSVTLRFKKAGEVTLTLPVRAAEGAADEHSHHHEGAGS